MSQNEWHCWSGYSELSVGGEVSRKPQRRIHIPEAQRAEAKGEEKRLTTRSDDACLPGPVWGSKLSSKLIFTGQALGLLEGLL